MPRKKKKKKSDDPKPLNFDHDSEKGPGGRLKDLSMTPEDVRGDDENYQYYEEEESLSPEETKKRKEEGTI